MAKKKKTSGVSGVNTAAMAAVVLLFVIAILVPGAASRRKAAQQVAEKPLTPQQSVHITLRTEPLREGAKPRKAASKAVSVTVKKDPPVPMAPRKRMPREDRVEARKKATPAAVRDNATPVKRKDQPRREEKQPETRARKSTPSHPPAPEKKLPASAQAATPKPAPRPAAPPKPAAIKTQPADDNMPSYADWRKAPITGDKPTDRKPAPTLAKSAVAPAMLKPLPKPVTKPAPPKDPNASIKLIPHYSVQVGYSDTKVRADVLRDVLTQQGYSNAKTVSSGKGYIVVVDKYTFRNEAESAAQEIKNKLNVEPVVASDRPVQ